MKNAPHRHSVSPAQGRIARLAAFAILFQALLFGWHHHPLPLPGSQRGYTAVSLHDPSQPLSPAAAEDGCDICATLHHLSASRLDGAALPLPPFSASATDLPDPPFVGQVADSRFRARGPPRV